MEFRGFCLVSQSDARQVFLSCPHSRSSAPKRVRVADSPMQRDATATPACSIHRRITSMVDVAALNGGVMVLLIFGWWSLSTRRPRLLTSDWHSGWEGSYNPSSRIPPQALPVVVIG